MLYLFLDESGDLGFDFVNKRPSRFFTICILAVQQEHYRALQRAVKNTLRRKLNRPKGKRRIIHELKGSATTLDVKHYFYRHLEGAKFAIYAMTLNKRRVYEELTHQKSRIYNFIARQVVDQIPLESASRVQLVVDKSKSKLEVEDFNQYIRNQLEGRLPAKTPFHMYHWASHEAAGLQAADLFSWGIFRNYERKDDVWRSAFAKHVRLDELYLPPNTKSAP